MSGKTTIAVTVRSHANLMQLLQYIRHQAETTTVFLVLDGYLDDPRPLHEIPEVRKMCLRLLDTGVASHLAASSIAAGAQISSARAVGIDQEWWRYDDDLQDSHETRSCQSLDS